MVLGMFHTFQMGFFLGQALICLLFLYSLHLGGIARQKRHLAEANLPSYLRFLHQEHRIHGGHMLQLNEHLVSPLLTTWVLSSLPLNIYFLVSLYFTRFTIVELIGGSLCTFLQASASSSILGLVVLATKLDQLPKMYRQAQFTLKGRLPMREKVKLSFWYEGSMQHKFYFTAGAMGKITAHLLFEVI